ncbi:hypothetical protein HON36_01750 [Candidatus Parcubacteria bacterium]|jgi:hypothetical protein|nr:hypothetical protein [Candidatus Parcubacteria bacterium]
MKIYFYSSDKTIDSKHVERYLKQVGIEIVDDSKGGINQDASVKPFGKMEALIFQGKNLDARAGYLIALALSQNKEVFCLLPNGNKIDGTLQSLKDDKNFNKRLKIEFYQNTDLKQKIFDFLKTLDKGDIRDLFNIKYTLRISRRISDYLNWKSKKVDMPKADWLRNKIKDVIERDDDYQQYLQDRYKTRE